MTLFSVLSLGAEVHGMADPTEPSDFVVKAEAEAGTGVGAIDESADLHLEAIIISGAHKVAVINQKIVEVGDKLGHQSIIKIEDYQVVLKEDKKKEYTLPLLKAKIKDAAL